jgi:hypothetical protein
VPSLLNADNSLRIDTGTVIGVLLGHFRKIHQAIEHCQKLRYLLNHFIFPGYFASYAVENFIFQRCPLFFCAKYFIFKGFSKKK